MERAVQQQEENNDQTQFIYSFPAKSTVDQVNIFVFQNDLTRNCAICFKKTKNKLKFISISPLQFLLLSILQ